MAGGPGKYDAECTAVRESTGASTVVLIVIGGYAGQGFEVQSIDPIIGAKLPKLLREMANQIEESP